MEGNKKKRVLVLCAEDSELCEKAMQYTSCNVYKQGDEVHVVSSEVASQQVQAGTVNEDKCIPSEEY